MDLRALAGKHAVLGRPPRRGDVERLRGRVDGLAARHDGVGIDGGQALLHVDREHAQHVDAGVERRPEDAPAARGEPEPWAPAGRLPEDAARKPAAQLGTELRLDDRPRPRPDHYARAVSGEAGAHVAPADALGAQHAHRRRVAHVDLGQLRDLVAVARQDPPAAALERARLRDHEQPLAVEQQLVTEALERQAAEQVQAVRHRRRAAARPRRRRCARRPPSPGRARRRRAPGRSCPSPPTRSRRRRGGSAAGAGRGPDAAGGGGGGAPISGVGQVGQRRRERARTLPRMPAAVADEAPAGAERLQPHLLRKPLALLRGGVRVALGRERGGGRECEREEGQGGGEPRHGRQPTLGCRPCCYRARPAPPHS